VSSLSENVCPPVLFTGIKVDYKKELNLSFGDYVEAYEKTDNTSTARTSAFIALFPSSNAAGSWTLWKLDSNCNILRTTFVKLITTEEVITQVNLMADGKELKLGLVLDTKESDMCEGRSHRDTTMITEDNEIGDTGTLQEEHNLDGIQEEAHDNHVGMRTRSGRTITPPSRFLGVTKIPEGNLMCRKTEEAISAELKQLFEDLQALHPVLKEDIPPSTKVLRSHMFVVEKYLACGKFDKVKARLVTDGRDQNPEMFPNKSSPTVSIQSVLAVLGIILECNWKVMVKIDINGAYVQTPMRGESVYMRINSKVTGQVVKLFPKYKRFVDERGVM
jgi:hypothetical protein